MKAPFKRALQSKAPHYHYRERLRNPALEWKQLRYFAMGHAACEVMYFVLGALTTRVAAVPSAFLVLIGTASIACKCCKSRVCQMYCSPRHRMAFITNTGGSTCGG